VVWIIPLWFLCKVIRLSITIVTLIWTSTWIVFGHIVGVHQPFLSTAIAGIMIHMITGISIGIVSGIFLYNTNILNITKPSNGLYLIFAIPVEQFVLNPEYRVTLSGVTSNTHNREQHTNNNVNEGLKNYSSNQSLYKTS